MNNFFRVTLAALTTIALFVVCAASYAGDQQNEYKKYHGSKYHGDMYEQKLDLNDEQKLKVQQINTTFLEQMKKVRQINANMNLMQLDLDDPAYHKKAKQIAKSRAAAEEQQTMLQAEKQANIYGILNAEQKQKFNELRNENMQKRDEMIKKREAKKDGMAAEKQPM